MLLHAGADTTTINTVLRSMEDELMARMKDERMDPSIVEIDRSFDLRYRDQLWEIPVPIGKETVSTTTVEAAIQQFHSRHFELYTYSEPENVCELVGLAIRATARRDIPRFNWGSNGSNNWRLLGTRAVTILLDEDGAALKVPVFDGDTPPIGRPIEGPALIAEGNAVVFVRPGWSCTLEPFGAYRLTWK